MTKHRRIFLSAVSSAFATARDRLANDLQANEANIVKVQRSFSYVRGGPTLLQQLADYIESCDVVICLVGDRSGGGFPQPEEAAPFLARNILPPGITEASYTQWEYFLARHFGRECPLYEATADFPLDGPPGKDDRPDLQAAYRAHLRTTGQRRPSVANKDAFRAEVLKDLSGLWHVPPEQIVRPKPIVLPYPSLGELFKGRDSFLADLRASLTRPGSSATAIAGRAVHGLGGVGKTRAAVEYAWTHRDAYTALLLIDADSPEKLQSGLAALVSPLRLSIDTPDETARAEAALAWLNTNPA